MRIYAFFTMNQQGWITRWNKSRMAMLGPLAQAPSYLATGLTVALVGFGVFYKGLSANNPAKATVPDPAPIVEAMSVGELPLERMMSAPPQQVVTNYQKLPLLLTNLLPGHEIGLETTTIPATRVDSLTTPNTAQKPAVHPVEAQPMPLPQWASSAYKPATIPTDEQAMSQATDEGQPHHLVVWSTILTPAPTPVATPATQQSKAIASAELSADTYTGTPEFFLLAIVPQSHIVNARLTDSLDAPVVMTLNSGTVVQAISRSYDNNWLQVILPDYRLAWVYTSVVTIDTAYLDQLPFAASR
jgi:hypothetical protein